MSETASHARSYVSPDDPFRYGWRYVPPAGEPTGPRTVRVPLSWDDLLHPQVGDFRMERPGHFQDVAYLYSVFKSRVADEPRTLVFADMRFEMDPDPADTEGLGPDVAVVPNCDPFDPDQGTFKVGADGPVPSLVVEVVSPHTRENDTVRKFEEYRRAGVRTYVILDAEREGDGFRLSVLPYRLARRRYIEQPLDARGRFFLEDVDVWIGATPAESRVRVGCWDPHSGEEIGDYTAMCAELERRRRELAEARRALQERDRMLAERDRELAARDRRLAAMEAEMKRLRGEGPTT